MPDQGAAFTGANRDQPGLSVGKVERLQCAGIFEQTRDVLGDHLFGANQDINGEGIVVEQFFARQIGRCAYAADFCRRAKQRVGHLAGGHVDLITAGNSNQHVGIFGTGLCQYVRV